MTDTVESVLAEMREVTIPAQCGDYIERGAFLAIADRLAAAHARDQADARRYRWLREQHQSVGRSIHVRYASNDPFDEDLDAAIDAHLSGGEGGGES